MKKILFLFVLSNLLFQGAYAFGECDVGRENKLEYANPKAAGCFILTPEEEVVLTININDKIQLLMGRSLLNETAQCTAIRETKEESGIDVTVGMLLHKFPSKKQKEVYLFHCKAGPNTDFKLIQNKPGPDTSEVRKVVFVDPKTLDIPVGDKLYIEGKLYEWRFPKDRILIRKLYNDLKKK